MVLDTETQDAIIRYVKTEPRAIQEIATHIDVAWVTAERYVTKIERETGILTRKTFREGTRGAVKLVYYNTTNAPIGASQWEDIFQRIRQARWKEDFDPMDIVTTAESGRIREQTPYEQAQEITKIIEETETQLLIFSGNFSFLTTSPNATKIRNAAHSAIDSLSVKALARANLASVSNFTHPFFHESNVEVRHRYQPLRGFISDETRCLL